MLILLYFLFQFFCTQLVAEFADISEAKSYQQPPELQGVRETGQQYPQGYVKGQVSKWGGMQPSAPSSPVVGRSKSTVSEVPVATPEAPVAQESTKQPELKFAFELPSTSFAEPTFGEAPSTAGKSATPQAKQALINKVSKSAYPSLRDALNAEQLFGNRSDFNRSFGQADGSEMIDKINAYDSLVLNPTANDIKAASQVLSVDDLQDSDLPDSVVTSAINDKKSYFTDQLGLQVSNSGQLQPKKGKQQAPQLTAQDQNDIASLFTTSEVKMSSLSSTDKNAILKIKSQRASGQVSF